jgi:protein TonB
MEIVNSKNYIAMTTFSNSERNFNEIIFENRNKEYGAYEIRKTQNETMTKSLTITLASLSLLVFLFVYLSRSEAAAMLSIDANIIPEIYSTVEVHVMEPEKPKDIIPEKNDPLPPKQDDLNLKVTDDPLDKNVKPVELMNVGAKQIDKGADSTDAEPKIPVNIDPPKEDPNKIVHAATEMPEFIGDMYAFIRKHLRYPQVAVENNTQGTVGLSFVVEKDGTIGTIDVLGRVPDGCTEEAIRVVKMMPKWKPGKNHGEPVRVQFNIPIKFKLK